MADLKLEVSNGHIDSLIKYVLDVKPYHTKLSEVVEEYLFEDSFNVKIVSEEMQSMVVMGLDYLKKSSDPLRNVWTNANVRPDSTLNAERIIQSDGNRRSFSVLPMMVNKMFHLSSRDTFTAATGATSIPGLNHGVFDLVRFSGPGIPKVTRNSATLTESIGFDLSHGVFSFTTTGQTWKQTNIKDITEYPTNKGLLYYKDVIRHFGMIKNIVGSTYEEWKLTWSTDRLTVVGSQSGNVGTVMYGDTFVHANITFEFTHAPGQEDDVPSSIENGFFFTLTPAPKITINASSPAQTWSLIKVNPIALAAAPAYVGSANANLSVYTRGCERAPAATFTITFTSANTYTLSSSVALPGYPKTDLSSDYSFRDAYLHFTINRLSGLFVVGDTITFTTKEVKENYLVYGSVSGWQTPAAIGHWYYNGHIGFKVPPLDYFVCMNGDRLQQFTGQFTALAGVHSVCEPSKYSIIFRPPIGGLPQSATVQNNIYGFRRGLEIGEDWSDEFCAWNITGDFADNEEVTVYVAPKDFYTYFVGYDEAPYDTTPYDVGTLEQDFPVNLLQEYFPLYHSHGAVIIPTVSNGDAIIIDKVERDYIRLNISPPAGPPAQYGLGYSLGASLGGGPPSAPPELTLIPELGDFNGWVPMEFRSLNSAGNLAVFPDYVATVRAFAASSPQTKILEIRQAVNTLAVLEVDEAFYNEFIPVHTQFTLRFHQNSSYAQTVRVKITEALFIDADIALTFDSPAQNTASTAFSEDLSIVEYESAVATRYNLSYRMSDVNGVYVPIQATEYVVTITGTVGTVWHIIPTVGSPFTVVPNNHPYDQIPTATSVQSRRFTVPGGTGSFTLLINSTP